MKNHENPTGTMKNQPGTMKNHENRPRTMKNQTGTIKKHENRPGQGRNKQKRYRQTEPSYYIYRFQRGRGQLMAWQIQEEVDLEEVSTVPVQV